jgi:hypothetical protein
MNQKNTLWTRLFALLIVVGGGCSAPVPATESHPLYGKEQFKTYWYSGLAEINSYDLDQSRYGESRNGAAVLIFVTEDLSRQNQVKLDDPAQAAEAQKMGVLKMNFTKNFVTGVYPYSMMLSVFTPIEAWKDPRTVKASMSVQEWCGQVYSQLNYHQQGYDLVAHSYFEKEGDEQRHLEEAWLEDELWNRIRLNPDELPEGPLRLIPGLFFSRLMHRDVTVLDAAATITRTDTIDNYRITIPSQQRELDIRFESTFPHRIVGWTEKFPERDQQQITRATLKKTLREAYWKKNKNEFLNLRDSLGLSHRNY